MVIDSNNPTTLMAISMNVTRFEFVYYQPKCTCGFTLSRDFEMNTLLKDTLSTMMPYITWAVRLLKFAETILVV